jgi:hypothetical protein
MKKSSRSAYPHIRLLVENLLFVILETMPLIISTLLKYKTVTLTVRNQTTAFGVSDTNHAVGHIRALDVLSENAPNLIYLLAQIWHVINRNIRLAIQYQRVRSVGKVHRNDAGNINLFAGWQRGVWGRRLAVWGRCLARTSAAPQTGDK